MSILKIIEFPNPILKKISEPIAMVDDNIRQLFDDMLKTMYVADGIGLSAVQVAILKRVIVIDLAREEFKPLYIANPEITWFSDEKTTYQEGCLSVPTFYEDVIRAKEITLEYLDYNNEKQVLQADGLLAICIQHEIDHLNGKVFLDRISPLKKSIIARKIKKGVQGEPRRKKSNDE